MADTLKLPLVGQVPKRTVIIGGVALGGLAAFVYWRNRHSASASLSTSSADTSAPDQGTAVDPNIDPETGFDYGTVEDQNALAQLNGGLTSGGLGGSVGVDNPIPSPGPVAPATNSAWAQQVEQDLSAIGYSATDVAAAVGRYLAKLGLSTSQQNIIQIALAEDGPPPQGSYSIIPGPNSGNPPPTVQKFTGHRQISGGKQSLMSWASQHHTTAGAIVEETELAFTTKHLTPANHDKFSRYLLNGTDKRMPVGLVFYSK